MTILLLLGRADGAKMLTTAHNNAVAALATGAAVITDGKTPPSFMPLVNHMLLSPPPAGEAWYLYAHWSGRGTIPAELLGKLTVPDGFTRAPGRSPRSDQLLFYQGGGGVAWENRAVGNLLAPRVLALIPPRFRRHVRWDAPRGRLVQLAPPAGCIGHGYPVFGKSLEVHMLYDEHILHYLIESLVSLLNSDVTYLQLTAHILRTHSGLLWNTHRQPTC